MSAIQQLLTDHIGIWTGADAAKRTGRGRASGNAGSVYGVKKLRELILELAVRGKLVPQDANDEPASELLKRIQAEKEKLVKAGKIKKDKPLAEITDEEKPFDLPVGWGWVRLGQIAEANTGYAFKSGEYTSKGTLVLRVTNINPDGTLDLSDAKFIDPNSAKTTYKNFQLDDGDVLLVMVGGSLGKLGVVDKSCLPAVLNQNMWKMSRFGKIARDYFLFGLRYINSSQIEITSSTHGHLAQGEYLSKRFPLPPLDEQHRIVAKVDELMALCDQLEAQHNSAAEAHEKIVSVLLQALTQSADANEFTGNWQRIAAHFDTLFTTEASIDALKQTLLQLAVMGKLVPQDANDEPAGVLLKRIQTEKEMLVKAGKIKKDRPLDEITEEEKPFELPRGWVCARLQDVFDVRDGTHDTPKYCDSGFPLVTSKNLYTGVLDLSDIKYISKEDHLKIKDRSRVDRNDILFAMIGSIGNPVIVETDIEFSIKNVALFKPYSHQLCDMNYLLKYLLIAAVKMREEAAGAVQSFVSLGIIRNFIFLMPPLAEQHHIVAKVDELMALCDQLKARIGEAGRLQQKIADVVVEGAVA